MTITVYKLTTSEDPVYVVLIPNETGYEQPCMRSCGSDTCIEHANSYGVDPDTGASTGDWFYHLSDCQLTEHKKTQ